MLGVAIGCDNEAIIETRPNCFELCLDVSADVAVDAHLAISTDVAASVELARTGLVAFASASRALTGFVQSMVDLNPSMPNGLSFVGDGLYVATPNTATRVELRFYLPSDTSYGKKGDLIDFNLFDVSNYFASFGVKASTTLSLSGLSTSTSFTFDGVGPGAELLGISHAATSPVTVDVGAFSKQLSKVVVQANVTVAAVSKTSEIRFSIAPGSLSLSAVGDGAIPLTISGFSGKGLELAQVLSLDAADLSMRDAGANYDGTLQFSVVSADFSFGLLLGFDASAKADIVVGCPGAVLSVP